MNGGSEAGARQQKAHVDVWVAEEEKRGGDTERVSECQNGDITHLCGWRPARCRRYRKSARPLPLPVGRSVSHEPVVTYWWIDQRGRPPTEDRLTRLLLLLPLVDSAGRTLPPSYLPTTQLAPSSAILPCHVGCWMYYLSI